MTIDVLKIKNKIEDIRSRLLKGEFHNNELLFDYIVLLYLLQNIDIDLYNQFKNENLETAYNEITKFFSQDFCQDSFQSLINNNKKIVKLELLSEETKLLNPRYVKKINIPESEKITMIQNFFKNYNKDMNDLFNELLKGNIMLPKSTKLLNGHNGLCYCMYGTNDKFILTSHKHLLEILPHEIAHAYQFDTLGDFKQKNCYNFSTFVESYSQFTKLAFLDFLIEHYQNSEYLGYFLKLKRNILFDLKSGSSHTISFISSIKYFDLNSHVIFSENGERFSKKSIDSIVSDFIAIHMLNLSKKDNLALEDFLNEFNSQIGISDKKIWDLLLSQDLYESVESELFSFNEEVEKYNTK